MDTQNAPMHITLWHRNFWNIALSNLLLTTSVYLFLPVLPLQMSLKGYTALQITMCIAAYIAGLYVPGCRVNYFVEKYRRNHVCTYSILSLAVIFAFHYFFHLHSIILTAVSCLFAGCFFSLAEMVLRSTLIVDTCESSHRTEGNHAVSWLGRLSLALGPCAGLMIFHFLGFRMVIAAAGIASLLAMLLITLISFPFRTPEDEAPAISLDRFFLVRGFPLFFNLFLVIAVVGMLLSTVHAPIFYALMLAGFMIAIIAEKYVFANAELKSEAVVGFICLILSLVLLLFRHEPAAVIVASLLTAFGTGLMGSRFLLFFIKLAKHCQRGTTQSTYFLGWETGLMSGVAFGIFLGNRYEVLVVALVLVATAFIIYNYLIHPWYLHNKNR